MPRKQYKPIIKKYSFKPLFNRESWIQNKKANIVSKVIDRQIKDYINECYEIYSLMMGLSINEIEHYFTYPQDKKSKKLYD